MISCVFIPENLHMEHAMDERVEKKFWAEIDEGILQRRILATLKLIRQSSGVDLKGAIDIYHDRYKDLRTARPKEFSCRDDEYWKGVYS